MRSEQWPLSVTSNRPQAEHLLRSVCDSFSRNCGALGDENAVRLAGRVTPKGYNPATAGSISRASRSDDNPLGSSLRWPSAAKRRLSRRSPAVAGRTGTNFHSAFSGQLRFGRPLRFRIAISDTGLKSLTSSPISFFPQSEIRLGKPSRLKTCIAFSDSEVRLPSNII